MEELRTVIPAFNIGPPDTPPDVFKSSLDHFTSIPWTAALLREPGVVPFLSQCRNPGSDDRDQLLGKTLFHDRAIPYMLHFYTGTPENAKDPRTPVAEVSTLYELRVGLTSGPAMLHGGMIMTMVDEALGALPELNHALGKEGEAFLGMSVTGTLEIKFIKPVLVEGNMLIKAWLEKVEGRKCRMKCEVKNSEGSVLAKCSSVWVALSSRL